MSASPDLPLSPGRRPPRAYARGATALGPGEQGQSHRHPRHLAGNAFRAVRVFAETAFSVVVLGQYDGRPTPLTP